MFENNCLADFFLVLKGDFFSFLALGHIIRKTGRHPPPHSHIHVSFRVVSAPAVLTRASLDVPIKRHTCEQLLIVSAVEKLTLVHPFLLF